jgi:hypothetical protein
MKVDFEMTIKLKLKADTKQLKASIKKGFKSLVKAIKDLIN